VVEGPYEIRVRVADGDGDKFHPPPDLLEGRDEKGYFSVFSACFFVASEVPEEPNLYEDEGA